jgi:hypothetical protein
MNEKSEYKSLQEWRKVDLNAFNAAKKLNLIDEICKRFGWINTPTIIYNRKPKGYWNEELCIEDAKKFTKIREWELNGLAYHFVRRICRESGNLDLFDKCTEHMVEGKKPNGYWTKEKCIEDAKEFKTLKEWCKNSSGGYSVSVKNKSWYIECVRHMEKDRQTNAYWTKEKCIKESKKYRTTKEWVESGYDSYSAARRLNVLVECHLISGRSFLEKKIRKVWTKDECIHESKKYKTLMEWRNGHLQTYQYSHKKGWRKECIGHMDTPREEWTIERCIEDAKKYKSRSEWWRKSYGYRASKKLGCFEECIKFMVN